MATILITSAIVLLLSVHYLVWSYDVKAFKKEFEARKLHYKKYGRRVKF